MATLHLRRVCSSIYKTQCRTGTGSLTPTISKGYPKLQIIRNFSDIKKSEDDPKLEEPKLTIQHIDAAADDAAKNETAPPTDSPPVEINLAEYTQKITIELPDLGGGKGKVLKWYKKEGDVVRFDDTICDIQTELFTFGMDVEDENEGIMEEILVKEGEDAWLQPGTPICTILHKPMGGDKIE